MSAPSTAADPTAVIGRRIVAYVIDTIMVWAIGAVLVLVLAEDTSPNDDSFDFVVEGGDALVLYLIVGVYALMTQVLQQGLTGATPGKLIAGVRCVKGDGSAPGILRALLRTLLLVIDAGFCYLPGLILAVVTKKHQRLGDLAASTYVVGAGSAGQPVDAPAGAQQADWTDPQWTAQPAATTGDQWGAWSSSPTGGTDQGANAWGQQPAEQQSPAAPAWGQQPAEQQSPAAPAWGQQPAEQQSPAAPAWGRASEPEQPAEASD
ncbi:MAG: RDD family protein, partial [Actinomycetota bacterium]|nr:RDD family protein [Actinomycetota bacterium]